MRFSIVVPVYNVEPYLNCCVESVLSQTFRDFELILVDDGSPDSCGKMCDAFAEKDGRVRVFHQENGGLSAARNTGICAAMGEYILFLDSDDWWNGSNVLEKIEENLRETDADVLSFNYRKSYSDGTGAPYFSQTLPSLHEAVGLEQILQHGCWVTGAWNKTIRRRLVTEHNLYFREGITSEDIDWTLRLALCTERYSYLNLCAYMYRQTAFSISHSMSLGKTECLGENIRECVRLLQTAPEKKSEMLKPFVAYQYGTLLHNAAMLPASEKSEKLMADIRDMKWLLRYASNKKVRILQLSMRIMGLRGTFMLLRVRRMVLDRIGKGV